MHLDCGTLIRSLSGRSLRYASTSVAAPKPRGRPPKTTNADLASVQKKGGEQYGAEREPPKPKGLSEIQAHLEATGYSRRKNAAIRKPKADAAPKTSPTAKAKARAKPPAASEPSPTTPVQTRKRRPKPPYEPLPPRLLPPTHQKHHDLASFLAHTASHPNTTNVTSTVYRGTHFEYTVAHTLRSLDFMLQRTGRSNDLGIDLVGHWMLPARHTMPVLVQCKAAKSTPAMVRELEGAYAGAPAGWRGDGVLGVLVSTHPATKGVVEAVQRSRLPLAVMQVTREGCVKQFVWNSAAAQAGLEGMGVAVKYGGAGAPAVPAVGGALVGPGSGAAVVGGVEQTIVLTWMGRVWRPVVQKRRRVGGVGAAAALPPTPEPASAEFAVA